ncbi:Short-chain dehydrogenase TIC 32, chloroplastic [Cyphellophora attinorum]|uniref:Short-chain dehydrogenase TIC 32, chloroplastic n=1 Tax=Cyphellophora attinorum TaxID=1664694 RepID=A0A0N1GXZ0_9EURO|nr:Short-chain dehydrogenase TIC 32, chloroplastic [Phialophora attinorum]KPI35326.1 Short-chain dehydrogenase TIC 32, chloroplastic [Phialophora attinorum]
MAHFGFNTTGDEIVEAFQDQVKDRTFLITGCSVDGIGAETAYSLAKASPRLLILAGRNISSLQPVIDRVEASGVKTVFLQLDLSSQASIKSAAQSVQDLDVQVDVLINNAGIMACPYALSVDNVETQFATNAVGPALFTYLLLKANLIKHRIVSVSSSASVRNAEYVLAALDDLTYGNGTTYSPIAAYSTSKAALNLFTSELSAKVKSHGISVFALNPGSIKSPLQRYITEEMRQAAFAAAKKENADFVPPVRKSLQEGCATQLRAALDPSLEARSGSYLDDCQVANYQLLEDAKPAASRVWGLLEQMTGTTFELD